MTKRIAIAHPHIGSGGSEVACLWMVQALAADHDVTLVAGNRFDLDGANALAGTRLMPGDFRRVTADLPHLPRQLRRDRLRGALFCRAARQVPEMQNADLRVSAYNLLPLGGRTLHGIADFSWDGAVRRAHDPADRHGLGMMAATYAALCDTIGGGMDQRAVGSQDRIFANSHWSQNLLLERFGLHAEMIYPPVPIAADGPVAPPIGTRSDDFVMLGRIAPEKRLIEAIDLVAALRTRGHRVRLHIIGPLGQDRYAHALRLAARRAGQWVVLHGGLYGAEKLAELSRHGFALQMRQREPFGIAVAELIAHGLIPFHPADSAPVEIVDQPDLAFRDAADAVSVIERFLLDRGRHEDMRATLRDRATMFAPKVFMARFRNLIGQML